MRMRVLFAAALLSLAAAAACRQAPPPAPAAPAAEVKGNLNQVMRGILFPNSNIIFDAQDRDPGADIDPAADPAGAGHPFAGTYGKWEAVENASLALAEAANLIALPGRTCQNGKPVPLDDPTFQKGLASLREVAMESYKVAQTKNMDGMLDVANNLTNACATCHDAFRDKVVDGKPIPMEARCEPGEPDAASSELVTDEAPPLLAEFRWMEVNLPGGAYLRESVYGFSILLTVHVVFMCLFLGLIIMMDLRLTGIGNPSTPAAEIQRRLFPWQMLGFAGVVISGFLLFYSKPLFYYGKGFFWTKMFLMAMAGVNAGVIHVVTHRSQGGWDRPLARFAGGVSLLLWAAVLVTGRLVAYEWWTTEYFLEDF